MATAWDFRPDGNGSPRILGGRPAAALSRRVIGARCDDHLRHYGSQPNTIESLPDHRLWSRAGEKPDWTLLRAEPLR